MAGGTGSGKSRLVMRAALALEAQGVPVTVVAPTEAGRQALLAEGRLVPGAARAEVLTLGGYLAQPVQRDGAGRRVVIVDDAHGLGVHGPNAGTGPTAGTDPGARRCCWRGSRRRERSLWRW